ncbi:hypothetical protein LTR37_019580 [Vermiconidia calcicola]|uniref:Uncharacterized protein n=1 Tax=Vermiconidia calcicola TaxID=1690605 RepID=A0ACC3MDT5_9PEZI|nr:hypothetical protein LTR37_019580 [Vermiconidia calcicola]
MDANKNVTPYRKCYACKNCQPMFPKPVERSPMTPRTVASPGPKHTCGRNHSRSASTSSTSSNSKRKSATLVTLACNTPQTKSSPAPTSSAAETGFANIDDAMARARAKYAENPTLLPKVEQLPQPVPTPEELGVDERLDATNAKCTTLLAEVEAQLAAPIVTLLRFSPAERNDTLAAKEWAQGVEKADQLTDEKTFDSKSLLNEILVLTDEIKQIKQTASQEDVRTPCTPSSPKAKWLSVVPKETRKWMCESKQPSKQPTSVKTTSQGTQTQTAAASASLEQTAPSPARRDGKPLEKTDSKPAIENKNDRGKSPQQQGQSNQEWHTLWSFDYNASW